MEADLKGVNLMKANLFEANLRYANLQDVNLMGADLWGCHLRKARNLTLEQLCEVKTLYKAEMDVDLLHAINRDYPHLLERPEE